MPPPDQNPDARPQDVGPQDDGPHVGAPATRCPDPRRPESGPADMRPAEAHPADLPSTERTAAGAGPAGMPATETGPADKRPAEMTTADMAPKAEPTVMPPAEAGSADLRPIDRTAAESDPAGMPPVGAGPRDMHPADSADMTAPETEPVMTFAEVAPAAHHPADGTTAKIVSPEAGPTGKPHTGAGPADLRPADRTPAAPGAADVRPSAAGPADVRPEAAPAAPHPAATGPADARPVTAGPADARPEVTSAAPHPAGPGPQDHSGGGMAPDGAVSPQERLVVAAALPHVAFDGWSDATLRAAAADVGMGLQSARALFPRGGVDLAIAAHRIGDEDMRRQLARTDLAGLRFRDRVALALNLRIAAIADREAARRASALFALPHRLPTGAALIWGTADAIWTALGDTSRDGNWYTKRATLAAVWAAVVLYWLGDASADGSATRDFIDRRIADVMRFEDTKARARDMAILRPLTGPLARLMAGIAAPGAGRDDLPGRWDRAGNAPDA